MTSASEQLHSHRNIAGLIFCDAMIAVMMVCMADFSRQVLAWLIPTIDFHFLAPLAFIITVEAIISEHSLIWVDDFSPRMFAHRLVEWIVLIVVVKFSTYFSIGFDQLADDLLLWDEQFSSFFSFDFLITLGVSIVVWLVASQLTNRLLWLYSSPEQLNLELEGINLIDRASLRRKLFSLIFVIGGLMLAVLTLLKYNITITPQQSPVASVQYGIVLVYFIGGFILLSQTQLFIHWSRWYLQRIPASPAIWRRWIGYSILMVAGAALIANLLPTEYSIGILGILQIGFGYLLYLLAILQFLLVTPILLLFNTLSRLFDRPSVNLPPPPPPPPAPMAPAGEPLSPSLWTELFRSILFWSVFFSVIFVAFRHYFRQNKEVAESLRRQPYLKWIFQFWEWLRSLFRQAKALTGEMSAAGRGLLKIAAISQVAPRPKPRLDYRSLSPRQQIRLIYLQMADWIAEQGQPRQPSQTPVEFSHLVESRFPEAADEVQQLTELFVAARYSPQTISGEESEHAQTTWKSLQELIKEAVQKVEAPDSSNSPVPPATKP